MREAGFSDRPLTVSSAIFVLSLIPFLFGGLFLLVPGSIKPRGEHWQIWMTAIAGVLMVSSGISLVVRRRRKNIHPDFRPPDIAAG